MLGSDDEEMKQISKLLKQLPASMVVVRYATINGKGVTPAEAYMADYTTDIALSVEFGQLQAVPSKLVLIECGFNPAQVKVSGKDVVVLDHHQDGDFGFDQPVKNAVKAATLGQFLKLLAQENLLRFCKDAKLVRTKLEDTRLPEGDVFVKDGELKVTGFQGVYSFPIELAYIAALDHNPGAVYADKVPGLYRGKAIALRNTLRAQSTGISEEEVAKLMRRSRAIMRSAPRVNFAGHTLVDLRKLKVAASNEVCAQDGIGMLYTMQDQNTGCVKEGIMHAPAEVIDVWMATAESRLSQIYGAPSRGYAGGYHPFDVAKAANKLANRFNPARQ